MIPLARNIKRYFSLKEFAIAFLAIILSVTAGVGVFLSLKKEVTIDDNGKQILVKTMKSTVREVLNQNNVYVSPDDYISLPLDSKLQRINRNDIYIKRAVPVNIVADGQEMRLMTYRDTVKEVIDSSPVKMAESDRLDGVTLDDSVTSDMTIKVVRVEERDIIEDNAIPYNVISRENSHMDKGTENTVRDGKEGILEKMYRAVFEDGKEITRNLVKETVASNPIDKIVEFGTLLNYKTARGDTIRYKSVLDMRASAYTAADGGRDPGSPGYGMTYTGTRAKKGTIAVDPRVIPLGTRVYVEVAGNTPDYGYAVAEDTGGAIKGDLIDLFFDDNTPYTWGIKRVKVYILAD